ncbi:MAG: protein translocase subunit SecF, partial [Pseudomonadota bacterium]
MRLKLVPNETRVDFLGLKKIALAFSGLAVVASIVVFFALGLNFGIDFRGGAVVEVRTEGPADLGQIRDVVGDLDLGDVSVQEFGEPEEVLIQLEATGGEEGQTSTDLVIRALQAEIGEIEIRRVEFVGPKVSGELV